MPRVEKTVFISYRRTNYWTAFAVYQDLTARGFDVFIDYQNIRSGDFEKVIIENIKWRKHFLVILSPSALERCSNPNDLMRSEIESALDEGRNIVPLMMEGVRFWQSRCDPGFNRKTRVPQSKKWSAYYPGFLP
ncbi:toll/interleukin-1 receptor domain-containing protein [Chloroflexi bacterium CFX2]|nr:toll/interleukin-1 receptor domain-containing protein [Chloroflexi bacterium CFX2]